MIRPLKKAHLPSADLGAFLRSDAIRLSYARQIGDSISVVRLHLLVRCIGPSKYPQVGGYDGCAPSPRSNVLRKYASARRIFARRSAELATKPRIWDLFDRPENRVFQHLMIGLSLRSRTSAFIVFVARNISSVLISFMASGRREAGLAL